MIVRKKTVAVALSGGIDSSCAAALLIDGGWEVIGVHLVLPVQRNEREERIEKARLVSEILDIPFHLLDVRDCFQKWVIDYFLSSYFSGLTPNPCVVCNRTVKFEQIVKWMDEKEIEFFATGHYARVEKNLNGRYINLLKGRDRQKDQSYFLHRLNQSHLLRTILPLGGLTKEDVYLFAQEKSLPESIYHESQEICFIPDNDYRSFLKNYTNSKLLLSGDIVDTEGKILGTHSGIYAYTIGQRHGLGVSAREPLYVCGIIPEKNQIVAGPKEMLFTKNLTVEDFNWIGIRPRTKKMRVQAQIRYRHKPAEGTLNITSPDLVRFEFDEPQWAITPGQALVCYEGERVLGGGWISKP
jgi:tRNA-specific 2-thiouridylase